MVKKISGLREYIVNKGSVSDPSGASPYHLVAILTFDSMIELQNALGSGEGQAAVADLSNFAAAGVEILMFESQEV